MTDCLFCKIVAGEVPSDTVHETETTVAFKDISPAAPLDMLMTARAVADAAGVATPERGYRLVFNIGADAMNSVPHLHLHVLGGEPLKGHFAKS